MRLTQSPDVWLQSLPSQNHRLKAWHTMGVHVWSNKLDQRRGKNISAVAVANKNARIAWALLSKNVNYDAAIR